MGDGKHDDLPSLEMLYCNIDMLRQTHCWQNPHRAKLSGLVCSPPRFAIAATKKFYCLSRNIFSLEPLNLPPSGSFMWASPCISTLR